MKLIVSVILLILLTSIPTIISSTTISTNTTSTTTTPPIISLQNIINDNYKDKSIISSPPSTLLPSETPQHQSTIQSLHPLGEEEEGEEEEGEEGGNLSAMILMIFFIFAVLIIVLVCALVTELHETVFGFILRWRAEREPTTESQHFENKLASAVAWKKLPPGARHDNII